MGDMGERAQRKVGRQRKGSEEAVAKSRKGREPIVTLSSRSGELSMMQTSPKNSDSGSRFSLTCRATKEMRCKVEQTAAASSLWCRGARVSR